MASTRLGADIGSTFTDLVALSEGELVTAKVPSTPQDQSVGVMNAIGASGMEPDELAALAHGMTVATNAGCVLQILLVIWYQGGPSPSLVFRSSPSQRNPLHFYPDRYFVRFKQLICKSSNLYPSLSTNKTNLTSIQQAILVSTFALHARVN